MAARPAARRAAARHAPVRRPRRGPARAVGHRGLARHRFYRVQPDEQGVVLRFGAFVRTSLPA
ncbi:MAG: hypothetical protein WDN49_21250 [Acetobacteraceae bacterium]